MSPSSPSPLPSSAPSVLLRSLARSNYINHLLPTLRLAIPSRSLDPITFAAVLNSLLRHSHFDNALAALDIAQQNSGAVLTPQNYSSVVLVLIDKSQLPLALSIFMKTLQSSTHHHPDVATCTRLLVALRRADMQEDFRDLFDELSKRNFRFDRRGYNVLIHAFGCWEMLGAALGLFRTLIQGCAKTYLGEEASRVFREMEYNGVRADTVIYNNLLDGFLKVRKLSEAC